MARDPAIAQVLMTADTVGGVWTYALELAAGLASRGVRVHLATMGAPLSASQAAQALEVPGLEIHASSFQLEWMDEPWADVERAGAWLLELERRIRPDLVHLNNYCHGHLPFSAPVLVVGHSCVLSWWEAVLHERAPERYAHYQREAARGLQAAQAVVAPSAAMLAALQTHYGPLHNTHVIYNGRDVRRFAPGVKEDVVFAAGRLWDQAKNISALAKVAPKLPWKVVVAGDTRSPDGRSIALQNVQALGVISRDEVAAQMARASIYAFPARYEPFGLSVLEAALSGCALVLGDIPSLRELWGQSARFVPPDDGDALERALRSLIDDPLVRNRLAVSSRRRALALDAQRTADDYLRVYAQLATAHLNRGLEATS